MEQFNLNIPSISDTQPVSDFNFVNSPKLSINDSVNNQKGGFLCGLFSNSSNKAGLQAAADRRFDIVEYLLKNNFIDDITAQDDHGNAILHYVARFFNTINHELLNDILNNPDIKSVINIQNNKGDTPAMVALKNGQHKFVDIMYKLGANFSIKNNDGLNIDTETIESEQYPYNTPTISTAVQNIKNLLNQAKPIMSPFTFTDATIGDNFTPSPTMKPDVVVLKIDTYKPDDTDSINENILRPQEPYNVNPSDNVKPSDTDLDTDAFLQNLLDNDNVQSENTDSFLKRLENNISQEGQQQTGGNYLTNSTENYLNELLNRYDPNVTDNSINDMGSVNNTEDFIQDVIDKYEATMTGGSCGDDHDSYTDSFSQYGGYDSYTDSFSQYGGKRKKKKSRSRKRVNQHSQLSRMIARQNKNIHREVVEKIQKILGVSEDIARNYKSLLWDMIKKQFPKLSNMDQSIEMDKFITERKGERTLAQIKKDLKKFEKDLKKGEQLRKKHRESSEKKLKERKKTQKKNTKPKISSDKPLSETSSAEVPDTSYSPTSFSFGLDSFANSENFYA